MRRIHLSLLVLAAAALLAAQPALAAPAFDNDAFWHVWERQDMPVTTQVVNRSWTWGPAPITSGLREALAEAPGGSREVQYFDKSRMEINDPSADPSASWYVANGLLPVELITGRLQVGFSQFQEREPAKVTAIGDPGQFPTYADLRAVYQNPGQVNPGDLGKPATGFLKLDGSIAGFNDYASDPATLLVRGENNHGVAKAFVDFMHGRGLVYEGGQYLRDQVYDPLFVFGLPITGAYWVNVKVGGVERPILFQVFERRVLTYNPANAPQWRVEMGNVGRHYFEWRYGYQP